MRPRIDVSARDTALVALIGECRGLGEGELLVLEAIAKRLRMGREQYGDLRPVPDSRDWKREPSEELLDGCVYLACETLRQRSKS